ncbi:MAG: large-conductance mechanosensitive channel protein MscL [Oscillospiraceae bacterium]|nr:large-conductance mechanosensitive channel protein MscL [Oscillospiraceae bacterium]
MKKFLSEFKDFAMRGNVIDMAIGVVIGGAFGKITTSLVDNIIMPLIGLLTGGIDLTKWDIVLKPAVTEMVDGVMTETTPAVMLGIGTLLSVILNFIIIAFVIFLVVKFLNRLHKKEEPAEEPAAEEPAAPTSEELLTEIRDLLKERNT